jgi:hypothetical protein
MIDPVTIMIAVAGILVPALFCVFTIRMVRREPDRSSALRSEITAFLADAKARHAAAETSPPI